MLFQDIKDDENDTSLGLKFLMVECYVRLGRELKSEKEMKSIREEFLMSPTDSVDLMEALADGYKFHDSSCVREIFVRKILSDMYFCSDLPHKKKLMVLVREYKKSRKFHCAFTRRQIQSHLSI